MAALARLALASVRRLAAAAIAGSILLIMPVAIWTSLDADTLLNTACVALASVLLSWAVVRQLLGPIARDAAPRRTPGPRPLVLAPPPACRLARRRPSRLGQVTTRGRAATPPWSCRAATSRPKPGSRLQRNVRCSAGAHTLARRTSRRRTRP